jgi:ABC-type multidrug transport system permease subunit
LINLLGYEIKRIVWSKKYLYIVLLIAASAYDSLTRLITGGYMGTAPFSDWSYTLFLNLISPLLMVVMIFIISSTFNDKEMRARSIIFSSPITQTKYYMLKSFAVFVTFILASLVPIFMSFIYYKAMFGYSEFGSFIKLIFAFLFPTFIFFLGLSMLLGKINVKLIYGLVPVAFLMGALNLEIIPIWADIFGNNFFNMYSFSMLIGREMEFVPLKLPSSFIYTRLEFILLGLIFILYTCKKKEKK